jgi:hypothetical protein
VKAVAEKRYYRTELYELGQLHHGRDYQALLVGDRSGPAPLVITVAVHTGQQGRLRFWDPAGCAVCRIARRGCPTVGTHGQVAVGKERPRPGVFC